MAGSWYLRGMWLTSSPHGNGSITIYTDMSAPGVLRWLDTAKDKLGRPMVRVGWDYSVKRSPNASQYKRMKALVSLFFILLQAANNELF